MRRGPERSVGETAALEPRAHGKSTSTKPWSVLGLVSRRTRGDIRHLCGLIDSLDGRYTTQLL